MRALIYGTDGHLAFGATMLDQSPRTVKRLFVFRWLAFVTQTWRLRVATWIFTAFSVMNL